MVEKIRFHASAGFGHRNCLFFGEWSSSKTFFGRWVDVFWTLAKKLQQIVKIVFLSVQTNVFGRKKFPEKNKQFHKISDIERSFFSKILVKEIKFWQKNISTVVKAGLYASRGTFWGKTCFPKKNQLKKLFLYFERNFSFFCRTCLACYQKHFTVYRWRFWEKSFFRTKNFLRNFFRTYAENCRTLAMNLWSIIESAFH